MDEVNKLLIIWPTKHYSIKNTGSNFQHPRIKGHSSSFSPNRNDPGNAIKTTRHSIFDHEKFWTWAHYQSKTNNSSVEKKCHLNELYTWAHNTVMWHWSEDRLFWQLTIDHNMDVHYQVLFKNTDYICLGHLASNARSLQENLSLVANQSEGTVLL